jgi:hypothetical protein
MDMLPHQDPPEGWPKPSRSATRVLSAAGFCLITLISVAVVISALATRDIALALIFALGAVLVGHLAGASLSFLRQRRPATDQPVVGVTDQGEQGLAFSYSRWPYYWLSAVLAVVALFAATFAVAFAAGGTATGWALAAVAAVSGLFIGWFLVLLLRLAPGRIVLTPTGIFHRSLVLDHFVPWEAVVGVQAREGRDPWITVEALPADGTRERRHAGRLGAFETQALPFMIVRTYWLGTNALPAYRALKRYFQHPAERSRLADIGQRARR